MTDLSFNIPQWEAIDKYLNTGTPNHILISGHRSSGKRTFINKIKETWVTGTPELKQQKIVTFNVNVKCKYISGANLLEVYSTNASSDKYMLTNLITQYTMYNVKYIMKDTRYMLIIIHRIDDLAFNTQLIIKTLIEETALPYLFICTCENKNKVSEHLKSMFCIFNLSMPPIDIVKKYTTNDKIIKNRDIREAKWHSEYNNYKVPYANLYDKNITKLVSNMISGNVKNIHVSIYSILEFNHSNDMILKSILKEIHLICSLEVYAQCAQIISKVDDLLINAKSDIYYYKYLIIKLTCVLTKT